MIPNDKPEERRTEHIWCEVVCLRDTDLMDCPLDKDQQEDCKMRRQYLKGYRDGLERKYEQTVPVDF